MRVSVVIPAYNAAGAVGEVVNGVLPYASSVVVVDDGSTDDTLVQARRAGATVVRHAVNRGYGAALVTGTEFAFAHGATIVIHFDADGQHEPADIPAMVQAVAGTEIGSAIGSRFLGKVEGISRFHYLTLRLASLFSFAMTGRFLTDPHNGLRAITASAWSRCEFRQDRMAFASEFIEEVLRAGFPLREVPTTVRYTSYSRASSHQGFLPSFRIVRDLFVGKLTK